MDKKLLVILSFLAILCSSAFAAGVYLNSSAAFALSGVALLPLVGIFAVGVLDYKVGGNQLTLEKRFQDVEQSNKELKYVVVSLSKAMFVIARGSSGFGGMLDEHYTLVENYLEPIKHHLPDNIKQDVISEVERIYNEHNKKQQLRESAT